MPTFDKYERLRKRVEFTSLVGKGTKYYLTYFIIVKVESELSWSRIGITASKKIGNSVARNRIKRLVREFFRNNKVLFQLGDYNIIARSGAVNLEFAAVCQELANGLWRIGQQKNH